MTSMKSRQMGVAWLFVMYLAMMLLFFLEFDLAWKVFSMTWLLCFLFQKHLPDMPYPYLEKVSLTPPRYASIPFFLAFSAPAIVIAAIYQVGLLIDPNYVRLHWPIERLVPMTGADLFHYKGWREAQAENDPFYDAIYLLIDLLNVFFFAFLFFVAHWSLGAVGFFRKLHRNKRVMESKVLRWWVISVPLFVFNYSVAFYVVYTAIGGESSGGAYSDKVSGLFNNRAFVFGSMVLLAWLLYLMVWALINNMLLIFYVFWEKNKGRLRSV
ncbi:hypothetical protein V6R97_05765 [Chromohalobacter salexigens]|uniref:hypothetical protein n=1 Tax=Chromohalobacter israelensis TaxID=141390 RepID=UPI0032E92491